MSIGLALAAAKPTDKVAAQLSSLTQSLIAFISPA